MRMIDILPEHIRDWITSQRARPVRLHDRRQQDDPVRDLHHRAQRPGRLPAPLRRRQNPHRRPQAPNNHHARAVRRHPPRPARYNDAAHGRDRDRVRAAVGRTHRTPPSRPRPALPDAHRQPRRHRNHRPRRRRPVRRQGLPEGQGVPPPQAHRRRLRRLTRPHREPQTGPCRPALPLRPPDANTGRTSADTTPARETAEATEHDRAYRTERPRPDLPARHPDRLHPRPCRCAHCKTAFATYRADRRAAGKDDPRATRSSTPTDTSPAAGSATTSGPPPRRPLNSLTRSASTTSATPTPPGYSPAAPTSKPSKNASATAACAPPRNTSTPCPTPTTPPSTHSSAPETAHRGRCCTPSLRHRRRSARTHRPYRPGPTAEGSLPMRELFGHRVELPSSPCIAGGNTSGVKRRRRDGAQVSGGTASRPRERRWIRLGQGRGLAVYSSAGTSVSLGLSDDLPSYPSTFVV